MTRKSWGPEQRGSIRLGDDKATKTPKSKPTPVPKAALEEGVLQLLASAAEMQQRQDLDSALQLYQAAMDKVKTHGLNRSRLLTGTSRKPPPLNSRTPIEWSLHVGDIASAVCLLGSPNAALAELRKKLTPERLEQVLDAGADIEYRIGPFGRTLLLLWVAEGNQSGVRLALDRGASVQCMDDNGDTALALNIRSDQEQASLIFADLLEAGANLRAQDGQGRSLFEAALAQGQPAVVSNVLETFAPLTVDQSELMKAWVSKLPQDGTKWTNRTCKVLRVSLNHGLDPNERIQSDRASFSLLEIAVERHSPDNDALVAELLEKGTEPNLEAVLRHGSTKIMDLVLTKCVPLAEIHHQQMESWVKTYLGRELHFDRYTTRDAEVLKLLLDFGLNPNLRHPTAPHKPLIVLAAGFGDLALIQKLIAHGAKLDIKDDNGDTALILAARTKNRENYDALKAAGLDDKYLLFGTVWSYHSPS